MNILVTGATGLIGRQLCGFLLKEHNITILSRDENKVHSIFARQVNCVTSLEQVDFDTIDSVINLAGEPIAEKRWSDKQKQEIINSRHTLTDTLQKKINNAATPPHTFISASAVGYYGRQANDELIDESFNRCNKEFSHDLCKEWESIALQAESELTRVCLLRTGIVLSKEGGALLKMLPAFKMGLGGKMASGKQMMPWIHINDVVNIIIYLLDNPNLSGPFNLSAPNPVSNKDFVSALSCVLSKPAVLPIPQWVLKCLFGEMSDLLIYGQKAIPKALLDNNYQFQYPQLNSALTNLLNE